MSFRAKIQSFISESILFGMATGTRVRLKNNGGVLEARDDADTSYIVGRGADPVGPNDWVTKGFLSSNRSGSAVLDFGATPGTNMASVAVVGQADITALSVISVFMMRDSTPTHNAVEHAIVPLKLTAGDIVAGVGFTIHAYTDWRLDGTFQVRWTWQ